MRKANKILEMLIYILLIIFAVFIIYQIILKILGGSWETQDILVSLSILIITSLFVIAGFLINQARIIGRLESNFNSLKNNFCSLAKDFKEHLHKYKT